MLAKLVFLVLIGLAVATLAFLCIGAAHASPLDCEVIQDPDQRNFCRAVANQDKTWCDFIHNRDKRAECRARVK
jgi:hypothetical protein